MAYINGANNGTNGGFVPSTSEAHKSGHAQATQSGGATSSAGDASALGTAAHIDQNQGGKGNQGNQGLLGLNNKQLEALLTTLLKHLVQNMQMAKGGRRAQPLRNQQSNQADGQAPPPQSGGAPAKTKSPKKASGQSNGAAKGAGSGTSGMPSGWTHSGANGASSSDSGDNADGTGSGYADYNTGGTGSGNDGGSGTSSAMGSSSPESNGGGKGSSGSGPVAYAGNGQDEKYTVDNQTSHNENFTYTDRSGGSATLSLAPGQTGTFYASSAALGDRITPDATGQDTNGAEKLFENGASGDGGATQNPDISAVDGNQDGNGNAINMWVTLPNGKSAGDGQAIPAYQYSTDDKRAMQLAGSKASSMAITVTDAGSATTSHPGLE